MFCKRILILFLLLFSCTNLFAAVFVVTSNADAGPGTLREALILAAANGTATKDYINFNLPDLSEAGRTIIIFSSLPDISSDLIIDGTTQPGSKFGISDAKVIIESGGTENFSCLVINNGIFDSYISNIEIYGLYIRNFKKKPLRSSADYGAVGIRVLRQCKNLIIGALGKGNIICGTHRAIGSTPDSYDGIFQGSITGVSIQCNLIGVAEDGKTANSNFTGISLIIEGGEVLIGGSLQSLGNIVAANGADIVVGQYPDPNRPFITGNTALIENNRIGTGINGTESYVTHFVGEDPLFDINYPFLGLQSELKECFVSLKNNIISGHTNNNVIIRTSKYEIKGNKIGTDITTTQDMGNGRNISLEENATGVVGGDDEADKNFIAFGKFGAIYGQSMVIKKNSFYCNQNFSINQNNKIFAPAPVIKGITSSTVTGTSKPGALIQLYYTADCTLCEGKVFVASINANAEGNWLYQGSINKSMIATATIDNRATSEFSVPYLNLVIDESLKETKAATCTNAADGYIKNILIKNIGTNNGPYTFTWRNENGKTVGKNLNLINVPKGVYTLEIKGMGCGSAFSAPIPLASAEIEFDYSNLHKLNASCNKANGSIIGITAPGATKFEWRDVNNKLAGSDPDLKNVPAGAYQLTATNNFGCSKTSQVYQILELPGTTYPAYPAIYKNTCFGQANGSISITPDARVKSLRWVNRQGQTINDNQQIGDLAAGTYKLYFTDQNDCESLYNSYNINEIPQLQIIPNTEQKTDDECDLHTGSIKNIQITGGLQPYAYKWYSANNEQVSTDISLADLSAGNYKLVVNDASSCGQAIANYSIAAHSDIIAAPAANNVQLCTTGNALLTVNGAVAGYTYRLYGSVNGITPLAEQANGRFTINAKTSMAFYISQVLGSCESSRTEVQVAISLSAINIANTITPNGDGINDYWKIDGIENYPNGQIQVFNRYGQKIFESKGYQQPFNGTFNGKLLPNGAYYYIINLNKNCSLLSGSLTIIR